MFSQTLIVEQHVLRFEVSVDNPLLVQVLQALDNLSSVVTGPRLVEAWVVLIHVVDVIPKGRENPNVHISKSTRDDPT